MRLFLVTLAASSLLAACGTTETPVLAAFTSDVHQSLDGGLDAAALSDATTPEDVVASQDSQSADSAQPDAVAPDVVAGTRSYCIYARDELSASSIDANLHRCRNGQQVPNLSADTGLGRAENDSCSEWEADSHESCAGSVCPFGWSLEDWRSDLD